MPMYFCLESLKVLILFFPHHHFLVLELVFRYIKIHILPRCFYCVPEVLLSIYLKTDIFTVILLTSEKCTVDFNDHCISFIIERYLRCFQLHLFYRCDSISDFK